MNFRRLLVSIACFVGAIWFGGQYFFHKSGADSSKDWHCVTGKMQVVTMQKTETRSRGRTYTSYTPHVSYTYSYKGQHLRGDVVSFPEPTFDSLKQSNSFQGKHSEGSAVNVWFDPKSPSHSCLIQGENSKLNNELYFALAFLVGGVLSTPIFSLNKSDRYLDNIPDRRYPSNFY